MRGAVANYERSLAVARRGTSPKAQAAQLTLDEALAVARQGLTQAESTYALIQQQMVPRLQTLQGLIARRNNSDHPLEVIRGKLEMNRFVDALHPSASDDTSDMVCMRDAIIWLAAEAGGLAEHLLAAWQDRFAHPSTLLDWINGQQDIYAGLFTWMYVSRNIAIHTGALSVPADALTSQAAKGAVDMILEFIGHWNKIERDQGDPDTEPRTIVQDLSTRKDALEQHLRATSTCRQLNVETITAPASDPWSRT